MRFADQKADRIDIMDLDLKLDFKDIRPLDGDKRHGFEELCCQMAQHNIAAPANSIFHRYEGAGGDGGVECVWILPDGSEWGWQAKYLFDLKKDQIDQSVKTALSLHPNLRKYYICMPFNLTGPKKGKSKSQTEKFNEYKKEWQTLAKSKQMDVDFIFTGKSEIIDFISSNHDKMLFWFKKEILNNEWFEHHLKGAIEDEPRYNPKLSIKVPVAASLELFGRTDVWQTILNKKLKTLSEDLKRWSQCISDKDFPSSCLNEGKLFEQALEQIRNILKKLDDRIYTDLPADSLNINIQRAMELLSRCEEICVSDLEMKHGTGVADSVGFRQFQAEYMCAFPTQFADSCREILEHLRKFQDWLQKINILLLNSQTMLLLGPAGSGKTHLICDAAIDRFACGLKSIVLLGKKFYSGELWSQVISQLGLSPSISRDVFLGMLNTAAEVSRYPLIIFIDALNESKPRDIWLSYLGSMSEDIKKYHMLRLCISCRSTYYDSVIPESVQFPQVEHTGFEGIEFDACFEFFKHYSIELPSTPLMQPEFTNPLFLRLVCESIYDSGLTKLPEKEFGLSKVIHDVLEAKNNKLAKSLDYNTKEQLVQKAIDALVNLLIEKQTMWLVWDEAKSTCDKFRPSLTRTSSLFEALIHEGILFEEGISGVASNSSQIRIGFERFSEYLIAEKYLEGLDSVGISNVFAENGRLNFLVADQHALDANRGVLEAMAIQIPEKFGMELNQVVRQYDNPLLLMLVIESLKWRTNSSITVHARSAVHTYFHINVDLDEAIMRSDALLSVSAREGNLLNAEWVHEIYSYIPMPIRDSNLQHIWHFSFGKLGVFDRLMRWALQCDTRNVTEKSVELWATQLLWFCMASDRRVRDYATKGLLRIMENHVNLWPAIIDRFYEIDDDYILERCLAVAYGSLTRANNKDAIKKTAEVVIEVFFEKSDFPVNALIRDFIRGILELACEHDLLPLGRKIEEFRPPYKSDWPLDWPDEKEITKFKDSYREFPKLYRSIFDDDFEKYIVGNMFDNYKEFNRKDALRWIFKHVLDMGYASELHAKFDSYILGKYGPGRAKPKWAERIGKKYQWIALYRLIGYVSDNATMVPSRWDSSPLSIPTFLAVAERNIDPTHYLTQIEEISSPQWWMQTQYDFEKVANVSDSDWLDVPDDFPNGQTHLKAIRPETNGEYWLILNNYITFRDKDDDEVSSLDQKYRLLWLHIHSFLIKKEIFKDVLKKVKVGKIISLDYGIPEHSGAFLGEYPWGVSFKSQFEIAEREAYDEEKLLIPAVHSVNLSYGFDSSPESKSTLYVPSPLFFKDKRLTWNGSNGYLDSKGTIVFENPLPQMKEAHACIGKLEHILNFLDENKLVLAWVIFGEKQKYNGFGGEYLGHTQYFSCHYLKGDKIAAGLSKIKRVN